MKRKIDCQQENFQRLCNALTMEELGNYMDCIGTKSFCRGTYFFSELHETINTRDLPPCRMLDLSMVWRKTPQGQKYWEGVWHRLLLGRTA